MAKGIRSLGAQSDPLGRTTRLVEISPGLVLEQVIPLRATEGHGLPRIATDCHGLPRIATDCHGLPRSATDCHGLLPLISTDCRLYLEQVIPLIATDGALALSDTISSRSRVSSSRRRFRSVCYSSSLRVGLTFCRRWRRLRWRVAMVCCLRAAKRHYAPTRCFTRCCPPPHRASDCLPHQML